nr:InlB B-repeat-containing protein [Saccharofermentans sp.]
YQGIINHAASFVINAKSLDGAQVSFRNNNLIYTGEELDPGVIVRVDGRTLIQQTDEQPGDYTVTYTGNTDVGINSATAVIQGVGSYTGVIERTFSISQATNVWTTDPSIENWTYGQVAPTPAGEPEFGTPVFEYYQDEAHEIPAVEDDPSEVPTQAGTYYMYAYCNETSNYTAVTPVVCRFTINKVDISGALITVDPTVDPFEYSGDRIEPETEAITVTLDGTVLTYGTDYTITYPDESTNPGVKEFTVSGTGNYVGTTSGQYTIYRKWSVDFYMNDGTDTVFDHQDVRDGYSASAPSNEPVREGYRFDGWCTDRAGDYPYDFSNAVTLDFPLYAKWVKQVTVSFVYADDPIHIIGTQSIDVGTSVTRPDDPVREGYVFGGWYADAACTTEYDFGTKIYETKTIYARWIPAYTVTFNTLGGSDIASQTVAEGGTATPPETNPVREGYVFGGWYAEEACTTEYDFSSPVTADVIIYAKWEEE